MLLAKKLLMGGSVGASLAFKSAVTATNSSTIQVPVDVNDGDIGVVIHGYIYATPGSEVEQHPAGWTSIYSFNESQYQLEKAHYKILSTSDRDDNLSITYATGFNDNSGAVLLIFSSGSAPTVTPQDVSKSITTDGSDPPPITINASNSSNPCIIIGNVSAFEADNPPFSSTSPAFDSEVTGSTDITSGYKIYNSSPQDHTIDMGILNNIFENVLTGFYLEVSE